MHGGMLVALTRAVPPSIVECELTHLVRAPIDVAVARAQHDEYERTLGALGCRVERVTAAPDMPDSVFIEDTAVVFDEVAIITRPGAISRRAETTAVASALAPYRPLRHIEPPGTIDGGDVLVIDKRVFVGLSTRTNHAGLRQLRDAVSGFGYVVTGVPVDGCLHLKSAVTAVSDDVLILDSRSVDPRQFDGLLWIEPADEERHAANVLRIGATIVCPDRAPITRRRLEEAGLSVTTTTAAASELRKAEGGLTCCSLIFRVP
jgi:dimethylargininase